jgi:probable HAF family extracellular repeat protein
MQSRPLACIIAMTLFAALAIPVQLPAQQIRYKLIDIPTLGAPGNVDCNSCAQFINDPGVVVGGSGNDAFRWKDGVLSDLGPGHATSINARGWATGGFPNAAIDPLTGGQTEHAVLWKDHQILDLGTLDHGVNSTGQYVNNAGKVIGFATVDTTVDPFPNPQSPWGSPIHAFISRDGAMRDLGTLGGLDSSPMAGCNNQRVDLVSGWSTTDSTLNPATGLPTEHGFLWQNGAMTDIPTLGGTFAQAQCVNNQGQVIGPSNLTGDPGCDGSPIATIDGSCVQHAFSWDHGTLTDLKPLGGRSSVAYWLNNDGEAVGGSSAKSDSEFHATLWKNGRITDLDPDDCFSLAYAINAKHQIIGNTFNCDTGYFTSVVWENGSIIDLNAAIAPDSSLFLVQPDNINDRGEIVGQGLPPGCDDTGSCGHVFLLIPCGAGSAQACDPTSTITSRSNARIATHDHTRTELVNLWRAHLTQSHHKPVLPTSWYSVVK